jgi:hypothetical protein
VSPPFTAFGLRALQYLSPAALVPSLARLAETAHAIHVLS